MIPREYLLSIVWISRILGGFRLGWEHRVISAHRPAIQYPILANQVKKGFFIIAVHRNFLQISWITASIYKEKIIKDCRLDWNARALSSLRLHQQWSVDVGLPHSSPYKMALLPLPKIKGLKRIILAPCSMFMIKGLKWIITFNQSKHSSQKTLLN